MPWTQTDIDRLKSAISAGRGARRMTFGDQTVEFHSVDEMLKLLSVMEHEVNSGTTAPNHRLAAFDKGV